MQQNSDTALVKLYNQRIILPYEKNPATKRKTHIEIIQIKTPTTKEKY